VQFLPILLFAASAMAQTAPPAQPAPPTPQPGETMALSLEDALTIAEGKSEQIAIARAGVSRAEGEQRRARSERYPQLTAAASYDRTLASEFDDLFQNVDGDGGVEGFEDLPFGQKNIWRLNLSFSQALYAGGRVVAQERAAAAGRSTSEIALASARAQLGLDVIRAYYDAALSDRLLLIAESTYKQADAALQQTTLAFQAGTQPEFERLRAQVDRDNQRPVVIRRRSERDLAHLRLKQLLEVPSSTQLQLTAVLEGLTLPAPERFATAIAKADEAAAQDRPESVVRAPVREAEDQVRIREAGVSIARAARLPSVNVNSAYGNVVYPGNFFPVGTDLRTNWTVGIVAQMPILTGGRLRAEQAIAHADREQAELRLKQARELSELDTRAAYEELRAARATWEASAGTVAQAARAYQIAEVRYQQGISTQLELSDSRLLLEQAEANRAMAARDLQVARARVALLPDLPLSPAGAVPVIAAPPAAPSAPRQQAPLQRNAIASAAGATP
jgi:outer membrane protein TolC